MILDHLEKLLHFTGVAKSRSIRGYAQANNISQPAVSKSLQLLESSLETTLLVRNRDGCELTDAGQLLFEFAEKFLAEAVQTESRIRNRGGFQLEGTLTIGTYTSIAVYFMPRFLKFLRQEQRDLELNIVSAASSDLIKLLRTGKLDFTVSVDPPSLSELSQTRIFEDYYSIYQKVGSAVSSGDASIFTLPWATDLTGRKLQEYLDKSPIKNRILSCGDFEAAKAMLENDVGFAFMPDRVASPLVLAGKIQKVLTWPSLNHIGKHWIVFSCRKHREADEAVIWMRDQLLRMLRSSI